MGLKRYMTGVAIAALLAGSVMAQTAPPPPRHPPLRPSSYRTAFWRP